MAARLLLETTKCILTALCIAVLLASMAPVLAGENGAAPAANAVQFLSAMPALFAENAGQIDNPAVRFALHGNKGNVFHTTDGVVFQVFSEPQDARQAPRLHALSCTSFSATFPGARRIDPIGMDKAPGQSNYFVGNNPARWRTGVATYSKVVYPRLYDGIDLHTFGRRSGLKYEFHVAPGADYRQIAVRYEGTGPLRIDAAGTLHVATPAGEVTDDAPVACQIVGGRQVAVPIRYRLVDSRSYAFDITGTLDPASPLVIDPELAWSTYLGGSADDQGWSIAVDAAGNAFVTGQTASTIFPATGGFDSTYNGGNWDVFIVKFSPTGGFLWGSYLGGSGTEYGYGIAIDPSGNALLSGLTNSTNFPVPGAFDPTFNGGISDAFVAKVTSAGQLAWSSYLGSTGEDYAFCVASDPSGNALLTGQTASTSFPVPGGFDTTYNGGSYDAFVTKVSSTCQLLWSTYLGGSVYDEGRGIACDSAGNAIVTGFTASANYPASGGFDPTHNGGLYDAFVTKISPACVLQWSSFLGGSGDDRGWGATTDASNAIFLAGRTNSANFPTTGGFDTTFNGGAYDAYVVKVTAAGQLTWGTYLGGSGEDVGRTIVCDPQGNVALTGYTGSSTNFPRVSAFQTSYGGATYDAFVAKVSSACQLQWSSFLGGRATERGYSAASGPDGSTYVTGNTASTNFPTRNAFIASFHGGTTDAFVTKVSAGVVVRTLTVQSTPITGVAITGTKPGTTNYTAACNNGDAVSLTAPATAMFGSVHYSFVRWTVDGADQPAGQLTVQITMNANHTAVAVYEIQTWTLAVQSTPITGVYIGGTKPGTTDYMVSCADQETVTLSAPVSKTAGSLAYSFVRWAIDGTDKPDGQLTVQLTMNSTHTAAAVYRTVRAILVGISDYLYVNSLRWADHDAEAMRIALRYDAQWADGNVQVLTNSAATKSAVQSAISAMAAGTGAEDTCIFYFSGHGSSNTDLPPYDESDGLDEYIVPYDSDGSTGTMIRDDELSAWFSGIRCRTLIVFFDTCFSGGQVKGVPLVAAKSVNLAGLTPAKNDGFVRDLNDLPNIVVLTACDDDELAYEDWFLQHGTFSYHLLEALGTYLANSDNDSTISAEEAYAYLTPRVGAYLPRQHPQLFDRLPYEGEFVAAPPQGPPTVIMSFNLDQDPGWSRSGQWAFGIPRGGSGDYGSPDPTSGHTGLNVFGYNLWGGYSDGMPAYYLTSTPINCSGYTGVRVRFWRWLGVESMNWDHARFQVSNDTITWIDLWSNPAMSISDSEWIMCECDISSVADGKPTVYLRWVMGPTDSIVNICGWNIDDIELRGFNDRTLTVQSDPIAGVNIAGDKPGVSSYSATCQDGEIVNLFAPASATVSNLEYVFYRWVVDGVDQPLRQSDIQIRMNGPHSAVSRWTVFGDLNGDCIINAQDVLLLQNRVGVQCE